MIIAIAADRLFWLSNCALAGNASRHAKPMAVRRINLTGIPLPPPFGHRERALGMRLSIKA
jgi:hypothetical protein